MPKTFFRFLVLVYLAVGVYVAWVEDYITLNLLKDVVNALIAIFLWFLVLLGVDLHVAR